MSLKNRAPKPTSMVPLDIQDEYNTILWYQRAIEDLQGVGTERARLLITNIQLVASKPSALQGPSSTFEDCDLHDASSVLPEEPKCAWYNRLIIPECIANAVANLVVRDAIIFIVISILLLLVV